MEKQFGRIVANPKAPKLPEDIKNKLNDNQKQEKSNPCKKILVTVFGGARKKQSRKKHLKEAI